jgi:aminomethyltransferase
MQKKTALYDRHVKLGAKMVDFHGWDMPLYYSSILEEHMAVREKVGLFDVSHMGDVVVEGKDASAMLEHVLPSAVSNLNSGDAMYSAFLDANGNIIDDTIVYRIGEEKYFFVPNASMIEEIYNWVKKNSSGFDVSISNVSEKISCLAIQGPESERVISKLNMEYPEQFKFLYHDDYKYGVNSITGERDIIISGTGYTGEKGVELLVDAEHSPELWDKVLNIVKAYGGLPCGLGARDTLRTEKGMLLSGTDFNRDRNPYECSISFIMTNDGEFIGKDKLIKDTKEIFRGFRLDGKIIPRHGNMIFDNDRHIGTVTSGTISPVLGKAIALGFIDRKFSRTGTPVNIIVRDKKVNAVVSKPKMVP